MWERACPRWRCISQLMYRLTLSHRGIGIYTTLLSSAYWVCVHIRCCGHGHLGFRPYGGSLWRSAKVSKTLLPHHSVPRLGSACPQSGIAPWARRDRPSMAVSRLPRHPCRGAHCAIPACGHRGLTGRLRSRSKARSKAEQQQSRGAKLHSPVGAGLPAMAVYQSINVLAGTPPSQASQLPQVHAHASTIRSAVRPPRFACDFDLRRPVKPRWPSSDFDLGGKPAGRRFSRAGPWMAHRGGPPNQCRMTGTPSLGEVPSGGARALLVTFGALFQK